MILVISAEITRCRRKALISVRPVMHWIGSILIWFTLLQRAIEVAPEQQIMVAA